MVTAYNFQSRLRHTSDRFKQMSNGDGVGLVTLKRDGEPDTEDVSANPIMMEAEEHIPGLSITRIDYQDFGIDREDYTFDGVVTPPQHGDTLVRPNGEEFRAVALNADEPVFQCVDSNRTRMIVHYQRTKDATP